MKLMQILSFVGTLGLGGLIGVLLKSFFDYRLNNRKMLFEARVKAYSGVTGRVFNLFLEPDITRLPDELVWAKLNALLSETMLMASHDLADYVGDFKVKVFEFHVALGKKDDKKSEELHKEVSTLVKKIYDQMRKDLHVDNKTMWETT